MKRRFSKRTSINASRRFSRRPIRASVDNKNAIIEELESIGMESWDNGVYAFPMDYSFYAICDVNEGYASVEWNPHGDAYEVYDCDINTVADAERFVNWIYNLDQYDMTELLVMMLKSIGAVAIDNYTYAIQNFGYMDDNVVVYMDLENYIGKIEWYDTNVDIRNWKTFENVDPVEEKTYHDFNELFFDADISG